MYWVIDMRLPAIPGPIRMSNGQVRAFSSPASAREYAEREANLRPSQYYIYRLAADQEAES